ncbi:MFS transporter [Pseudonocardia benzenivorans]
MGSSRAIVAVSTVAVGLGTAPAFLFGFLGPVLQDDLGLSRTRIGLLVGLMFGLTGIGCLLAGRVTERIGARWTVVLSTVLLVVALCAPLLSPAIPRSSAAPWCPASPTRWPTWARTSRSRPRCPWRGMRSDSR